MQNSLESKRTLPCWGSLLHCRTSAHSTIGSFSVTLNDDPGRWQRPFPGTQPPGVQGPCSGGQSWVPLAAHLPSQSCSQAREKGAALPCPSDTPTGSPFSAACPPAPNQNSQESHPDSSYQPWHVPGLGDPSKTLICIALQPETYRIMGSDEFSATEL